MPGSEPLTWRAKYSALDSGTIMCSGAALCGSTGLVLPPYIHVFLPVIIKPNDKEVQSPNNTASDIICPTMSCVKHLAAALQSHVRVTSLQDC
ncbi:hypothetical protein E2C01_004032 [Portunus trituberculatus]|uniref:Uncharacterized protein n=1 Tax=Portunus trituberculatus TaxID=210409 RepID=A0A5B7CPG3_PORTR|nr:hypothetical protein [Portunus trituberculatus]